MVNFLNYGQYHQLFFDPLPKKTITRATKVMSKHPDIHISVRVLRLAQTHY